MSSVIELNIRQFTHGSELPEHEAEELLDAMITAENEALLSDLFVAWNNKGITENEIYSFAKIMRQRMSRVRSVHDTLVDIVGTGGSRSKTFNVSTAASFVVAGEGVAVAKHGNKAATSNSGSADVLTELGINPAVDAQTAERCLNDIGICFMFAPNYHRLSATLAKVRRGLGFPTIFNCVGPLCNPASAQFQLIGVWDKKLLPKMADALLRLGTRRSWVVHSEDGLDEISLCARTFVTEVSDSGITEFTISPDDFGMQIAEVGAFSTSSSEESAEVIMRILGGLHRYDAVQDLVLINAAAALCLTDRVDNFHDGVALAFDSISGGHAMKKMKSLSEAAPV